MLTLRKFGRVAVDLAAWFGIGCMWSALSLKNRGRDAA